MKMTQPVKTLTNKFKNLDSNPRTHLFKGKNRQAFTCAHALNKTLIKHTVCSSILMLGGFGVLYARM